MMAAAQRVPSSRSRRKPASASRRWARRMRQVQNRWTRLVSRGRIRKTRPPVSAARPEVRKASGREIQACSFFQPMQKKAMESRHRPVASPCGPMKCASCGNSRLESRIRPEARAACGPKPAARLRAQVPHRQASPPRAAPAGQTKAESCGTMRATRSRAASIQTKTGSWASPLCRGANHCPLASASRTVSISFISGGQYRPPVRKVGQSWQARSRSRARECLQGNFRLGQVHLKTGPDRSASTW